MAALVRNSSKFQVISVYRVVDLSANATTTMRNFAIEVGLHILRITGSGGLLIARMGFKYLGVLVRQGAKGGLRLVEPSVCGKGFL